MFVVMLRHAIVTGLTSGGMKRFSRIMAPCIDGAS